MAFAPKQPISLDRPSRIVCASSLPQPAPLLRRHLGRDKALFSVCVCVRAPYERPCSPSVSSARPSLLARCVYSHPSPAVSPSASSLLARCVLFTPALRLRFVLPPHERPCSPSAFRPSPHDVSGRPVFPTTTIVPSLSVSSSLPFPSSPLRLQPPSPFSGSLASRPSLLARCIFPPTAILPSPAVSSSRPSLLACCVIPRFVHPAFSGRLVFPQTRNG